MAAADAAAYEAFMFTSAGQFTGWIMDGIAPYALDITEAHLQAAVLAGEETDCY